MASLKAVKPTGLEGQAKEPTKVSAAKGPAKLSATATKPALIFLCLITEAHCKIECLVYILWQTINLSTQHFPRNVR